MGIDPNLVALMEGAEHGNKPAAGALFTALYSELRRLAKLELSRHCAPISLSATTLIHKAYIEIAGRDGKSFLDCNSCIGYAARVMRGLITDHARSCCAQKRGGQFGITSLGNVIQNAVDDRELAQIGDTLDELAEAEAVLAELVDLKFFCELSFAEIAALRDVSERTVQRQWEKARIYLHRSIRADLEN